MTLDLGPYHLEIASDFGPRLTSLRLGDGREQLAILGSDVALDYPGGRYEFRGGHRLWAAPEDPEITYAPDDHPCEIASHDGVVSVRGPADTAGLTKEIIFSSDGRDLVVEHRLSAGEDGMRVAPWAITQFPLGGTAILPFEAEDTGARANRYMVFWPYTSIEDRRISFYDEALELKASEGPQLKVGLGPSPGRLGYYMDGSVFIKEIEPATARDVPEFGAVGQVYIGQGFCELESVGAMTDLGEEATASLRERWTVLECADLDAAVQLTLGA